MAVFCHDGLIWLFSVMTFADGYCFKCFLSLASDNIDLQSSYMYHLENNRPTF